MPGQISRASLLWPALFILATLLTPALFTSGASAASAPARQQTTPAVPGIDPNYIYQQLDYMVTHFQRREAGYDNNLPPDVNGHDEFASYWTRQMLSLLGRYGAVAYKDTFPIAGWQGRPAKLPAFNMEITVPGVLHPEQEVVIGCHYDGMAFSTQSANDDGSGCAIELGIAKAMSAFWQANHVYPARTLRFVIFDAEEQGLFGSYHYVNSTVNGDLKNITAMFNEEQNGIAYPLRYLGTMVNPLMPYYIDMSPLRKNSLYTNQDTLSTQQRANISRFRQLMAQAVPASFQQFRAMGDQMLTYHSSSSQDVWQPIFTPDQLSLIHQEDDTLGSSDQMPFTMAGLPCATLVGNSTYYNPGAPPGSYPYDQPDDTIQLMNIFADGNSRQSQALTLALALPGMITTWMLAQPDILGQTPFDGRPVAAISSIGLAQPGQALHVDASASYDPAAASSPLSYQWSFGDGTGASGQKVSHTYTGSGTYTLSLTVSSADGKTRVITKQITVATAPTLYNNPYTNFRSNGRPPHNANVTLPSANAGLSDRVGTVAAAAKQGPITHVSLTTVTGLAPQAWIGIGLLVVLVGTAGILLGVRRRAKSV
jgi:hypothetical protein